MSAFDELEQTGWDINRLAETCAELRAKVDRLQADKKTWVVTAVHYEAERDLADQLAEALRNCADEDGDFEPWRQTAREALAAYAEARRNL